MALSDFDFNGALNTVVGGWATVESSKQNAEAIRLQNTQPSLGSDQLALRMQMSERASASNSNVLLIGLAVVAVVGFLFLKK